jgi:hypothetical protein
VPEYGDAIFTTVHGQGYRIDKADPLIRISDELIDQWRSGPAVSEGSSVCLHDDLVYFHALNGTVTYRLGEHLPDERSYTAERISITIEFVE